MIFVARFICVLDFHWNNMKWHSVSKYESRYVLINFALFIQDWQIRCTYAITEILSRLKYIQLQSYTQSAFYLSVATAT